jgi:dehydrogenase/reductase SDR family protein 12
MGTDTNVTPTSPPLPAAILDRLLDLLVVPGYSSIGPRLRKAWWPPDPVPFTRPTDVVVTGGSSGLGAAAAAGLAALGARVHLVGRDADRLGTAAAKIRLKVRDAEVVHHESDISDLDAVRALVDAIGSQVDALHGLVHCAGIMPPQRTTTAQGHELAFATHVLGPFLVTAGLRTLLQADGDARVVWVSSGGMYTQPLPSVDLEYTRGQYKGATAYARTKRMQVVLAEEFAAAFTAPDDPVVHSMHPGWAATPGVSGSLPAFEKITRPILRSPEQGADTIVWLAASPEAAVSTGQFWHDRRVRPTHYLPWQRDDPAARQKLWDTCVADTGVTLG